MISSMLKRFEQGVRSFHLSPLRTELFIADAVYCEWKHLPVQLCPHDSGPLPPLSLSLFLFHHSRKSLILRRQHIHLDPRLPSLALKTQVHTTCTHYFSQRTRLMAHSFCHQIYYYWFWHLHFYKITAFFSAGVYSSNGFRDSGDIPLWKIVNL